MRALDPGVRPLQRLLGRCGEHHEETRGIGAVLLDQRLRVHAVVLRLGHGGQFVLERRAVGLEGGAGDLSLGVAPQVDLAFPEVVLAAALGFLEEGVVEHHALGQQMGEGFAVVHQAQVAHHLGPEARIEQVQDGVFDTADVLVHRHPVIGFVIDHAVAAELAGVARVVPGRIDEGVHGVGFTPCRLAAPGAIDMQEIVALAERIARAVGHAVLGQHHRKLLVGYRHRTAVVAVDDGDRAAPVALARHAPVAQPPLHLLFAQAPGGEVGGDRVDRVGIG